MSQGNVSAPAATGRRANNYFDGMAVTGYHKVIFFIIMLAYFFEQMDNWKFWLYRTRCVCFVGA